MQSTEGKWFRWQSGQPLVGTLAHTKRTATETNQDAVKDATTTVEDLGETSPSTCTKMVARRMRKRI